MYARQKISNHQRKKKSEKRIFRGMKKALTKLLPGVVKQTIVSLREEESAMANEIKQQGGDATRTVCKQCGEYHPGWICYKAPEEYSQDERNNEEKERQGRKAKKIICTHCWKYQPECMCYKIPGHCLECGGTECEVQECKNPRNDFFSGQYVEQDDSSDDETASQAIASEAAAQKEMEDWYNTEVIKHQTEARNELYSFANSDMTNQEANYCLACRETGHTASKCGNTPGKSQHETKTNQNHYYDLQQQYKFQPLHKVEPTCISCGMYHLGEICLKATGKCYNCGEAGHMCKVCKAPRGTYKAKVRDTSTSNSEEPMDTWYAIQEMKDGSWGTIQKKRPSKDTPWERKAW